MTTTSATTAAPPAATLDTPRSEKSWWDRHAFLMRRLHSLSGILPIGVFLIIHLVTNSSILWGKWGLRGEAEGASIIEGGVYYFVKEVGWINQQIPHLIIIEVTLWVSIFFHSALGLVYAMSGKRNTTRYPYMDNWRYSLQRWTGYIGIFYIFYHVATLRWEWHWLVPGGTQWSYEYAASTLAMALRGGDGPMTTWGLIVSIFYFIGITALVYHFANGLWTAAITWGITISEEAQRRWARVCFVIGAGLMLLAWGSLFAFATLDPAKAEAVERKLNKERPEVISEIESGEPNPDVPIAPALDEPGALPAERGIR